VSAVRMGMSGCIECGGAAGPAAGQ
jgi:hypothetical protein